jgi:hypothetical protein
MGVRGTRDTGTGKEDDMANDSAPAAAGQDFSAPRGGHTQGRLEFTRGAAHLDADLRDLRLEALELGQGASQVEVRLARPAGVVPVRVRGGASQVRIRRPAGVPVRLRVGRGVADLRFDEQEWGAVGGGLRLETPEATQAPDRYEVEVASGAAHLELTAE